MYFFLKPRTQVNSRKNKRIEERVSVKVLQFVSLKKSQPQNRLQTGLPNDKHDYFILGINISENFLPLQESNLP